jgi:hypothetical protein
MSARYRAQGERKQVPVVSRPLPVVSKSTRESQVKRGGLVVSALQLGSDVRLPTTTHNRGLGFEAAGLSGASGERAVALCSVRRVTTSTNGGRTTVVDAGRRMSMNARHGNVGPDALPVRHWCSELQQYRHDPVPINGPAFPFCSTCISFLFYLYFLFVL